MKEAFKPFDKVLVRISNKREWKIELFERYLEGRELPYLCMHDYYRHCIPYEGNEHLLGTTDSTKPKRWRAEIKKLYFYVTADLLVTSTIEFGDWSDDIKYENGNYFKTSEEAEEMAKKIKKLLNNG